MLLEFTVENFQSIKNRTTLYMTSVGGKEITEFKSSLINEEILPAAVIYGPNGGGKSTLIRAFQTMQSYIVRFFERLNGIPFNMILPAIKPTPFKFDNESIEKPTSFEVLIALKGREYKYGLCIQNNIIIKEYLHEKHSTVKELFERTNTSVKIHCDKILTRITNDMASNVKEDTPLLVFIKSLYKDVEHINEIIDWFYKTIYVDYNSMHQEESLMMNVLHVDKNKDFKNKILKMLKHMGLGLDSYNIEEKQQLINTPSGHSLQKLVNINTIHKINETNFSLPFKAESNGTQKIFGLIPLFIASLTEGRTLFIDELDAKLHPKLLENIISLYTDKSTNTSGGQLIFTSHDMTTMSPKILRRDQIYFMALSEEQDSELFSLVEIRGKDGRVVRNDGSFSKQYLEGRYGADPYFAKIKSW